MSPSKVDSPSEIGGIRSVQVTEGGTSFSWNGEQVPNRNSRQANNNTLNCNKGSSNDITGSSTTAKKNNEKDNCQLKSNKGSIGNVTGSSTTAKKNINGYTNSTDNNGRRQVRDWMVFEDGSNERLRRRQRGTGLWRDKQAFQTVNHRAKQFSRAAKVSIKSKINPSNQQLIDTVNKDYSFSRKSQADNSRSKASRIALAQHRNELKVQQLTKEWTAGGLGYVPDKKPDGTIRIMWENWNSIKLFTEEKNDRINHIEGLRKKYDVDILAGCETQTNWNIADDDKQFENLFGFGEDSKSRAAHNSTEQEVKDRCQPGGTAIISFGRTSHYVTSSSADETGLGRWVYQTIKNYNKTVHIVSAYRPCKPADIRRRGVNKSGKGSKVWEQHVRYFKKKGILDPDPRELFDKDLFKLLRSWRMADEEIILMGDFNDNIYTSPFARTINEEDIELTEQFHKTHLEKAPASHFTGSKPIIGIFATPGIDCQSAFISKYKMAGGQGVGDHRLHIFDFSTLSILGQITPATMKPGARKLQCSIERTKTAYNKVLLQLTTKHRMFSKMNLLNEALDIVSPAEFQLMFNAWDKQMIQLMLSAENNCRKYKNDYIPFCPIINLWIQRLNAYRWIKRFKSGRNCNTGNLKRTCRRLDIPSPMTMTLTTAEENIEACRAKLQEYRDKAPQMRMEHLQNRLKIAQDRNDETAEKAIIRILRREFDKKRYRRLKIAFGKRKALPASQVAVECTSGPDAIFSTKEQMEEVVADMLTDRFQDAHRCPIGEGQLLEDLGYLADTPAAQDIINGTYNFPENMCKYTRLLLEEASHIFHECAGETIKTHVSSEDFRSWWSTANEKIQSSKSGAHFGHYKAAAYNKYLTGLHVAKMNLVLRTGIPLERWGHGITVLLEKKFGSIYIDKLRAICLFEADFNWLTKIVFSKKMISNAKEKGIIPDNQFATSGTNAVEGIFVKSMAADINRTLHIPSATVSADLSQCYDAVNHAMCSIALQAFGVPMMAIKFMLICLQSMKFWLRSAHGVADNPFSAGIELPFMGLGQGSGSAASAFTADSALMINAYKRLGHGCRFTSCITGTLFFFAAIVYVDDTDLLIQAKTPQAPRKDLFKLIQDALNDWTNIVMASGGSNKPKKCHVSIADYKYVKGVAKMKSKAEILRDHPRLKFTVPMKEGPPVEFDLNDPKTSKLTLGMYTNLAGEWKDHLKEIERKGLEWSSRLRSNKYLKPDDGWLSLNIQLKPSLEYGLVCVSECPLKVNKVLDRIYYRSLGRLRVNCHIRKEFRTLPKMYQGLGMFDLNVDNLGLRIHFLRQHWGIPSPIGNILRQGYEAFLMDVGLNGNIFTRDFERLGQLAADGWFKTTWQLCRMFNVDLRINECHDIPLIRQNDKALMECFLDCGRYNIKQLVSLNIYRKFKQVHSLADITCCDGQAIDPKMILHIPGGSSRTFSYENPQRVRNRLWKEAVMAISSPQLHLQSRLGGYTHPRHALSHHTFFGHRTKHQHVNAQWFASDDQSEIFRLHTDGICHVYKKDSPHSMNDRRATRSDTAQYKWSHEMEEICDTDNPLFKKYATVQDPMPDRVSLHSTIPIPAPDAPPDSILDTLKSWPNQSLWKYFRCDGDGRWIRTALLCGDLKLVHDGSYMQKLNPNICSAAFILKCNRTGKEAIGTLVEESKEADNYRAEALGAIGDILVIMAATQCPMKYKPCQAFCDNMGIVKHASRHNSPIGEKQVHADVISLIKQYIRDSNCPISYDHVYGHLDDILQWDQLSETQKLNVRMDALAKRALMAAITNRDFITSIFPFEHIVMKCGGQKNHSSPTKAIYRWWGCNTARRLFHCKDIVKAKYFDYIYWDGMDHLMNKKFPRMFCNFLTKHVSRCNGSNYFMSKWDKTIKNRCPACGNTHGRDSRGRMGETTEHIVKCKDQGRTEMYHASVREVTDWMEEHHTDPVIIELVSAYLGGRGEIKMSSLIDAELPERYRLLCKYQDYLGWQNMIEGRFLTYYLVLQREFLEGKDTYLTAETWARGFMERLIRITHRQWLHRNAKVHFKGTDGRTLRQHEAITERIKDLLWTDPDDLLEEDRCLLAENPEKLANAKAVDQEYWIASVDASIQAVRHKRKREAAMNDAETNDLQAAHFPLSLVSEGSARWKKRKKKH